MRTEEQKALDREYADYGCTGTGEYSRCADMSDRFEELLAIVEEMEAAVRLSPVHALIETWKPGERVELVQHVRYGISKLRPGTVARIDRTYGYRESLVVEFDDGETRAINPDVMRHVRSD